MKKAFTMTVSGQTGFLIVRRAHGYGFTMAEILISLTIVGVIAAITLPSLTGNVNERTWNTQRKALYSRFSQAVALMPALSGYGTLTDTEDTATETFITNGLAKVLKINNICDSEHLSDCGVVDEFTTMDGNKIETPVTLVGLNQQFNISVTAENGIQISYSQKDTKAAAFETTNGESILTYYYPYCISDTNTTNNYFQYKMQPFMCANFIYDLNGKKGPNTVGKDIGFITAIYPTDSVVVAPMPNKSYKILAQLNYYGALDYCRNFADDSRLPNIDELFSLYVNKKLFKSMGTAYLSSTKTNGKWISSLAFFNGERVSWTENTALEGALQCIKR